MVKTLVELRLGVDNVKSALTRERFGGLREAEEEEKVAQEESPPNWLSAVRNGMAEVLSQLQSSSAGAGTRDGEDEEDEEDDARGNRHATLGAKEKGKGKDTHNFSPASSQAQQPTPALAAQQAFRLDEMMRGNSYLVKSPFPIPQPPSPRSTGLPHCYAASCCTGEQARKEEN